MKKCPVCGKKLKSVASHIRKSAMAEIYRIVVSDDEINDVSVGQCPHQEFINQNSSHFKYPQE